MVKKYLFINLKNNLKKIRPNQHFSKFLNKFNRKALVVLMKIHKGKENPNYNQKNNKQKYYMLVSVKRKLK